MTKLPAVLAVAAVLAVGSAAHAAAPASSNAFDLNNFSGYVRGYWSDSTYSNTSAGWDGYDPWIGHGADGAANWHLPNDTDLEFEARHWYAGSDSYNTYGNLAVLHWSKRNQQYLVGGFGGVMSTSTYYDTPHDDDVLFGIEGQYYLRDDITLYGQAGLVKNNWAYYTPEPKTIEFTQLTGRYFWRENTKLELGLGYMHDNQLGDSVGENMKLWDYSAEVEHHFAGTGVGVFASYDWWDHSDGIDTEGGDHTWKVGMKFSFNAPTLRDEDRKGASLKVIDFAPLAWLKLDGW